MLDSCAILNQFKQFICEVRSNRPFEILLQNALQRNGPLKLSTKIVHRDCSSRLSIKTLHRDSPSRLSIETLHRDSPQNFFYGIFSQRGLHLVGQSVQRLFIVCAHFLLPDKANWKQFPIFVPPIRFLVFDSIQYWIIQYWISITERHLQKSPRSMTSWVKTFGSETSPFTVLLSHSVIWWPARSLSDQQDNSVLPVRPLWQSPHQVVFPLAKLSSLRNALCQIANLLFRFRKLFAIGEILVQFSSCSLHLLVQFSLCSSPNLLLFPLSSYMKNIFSYWSKTFEVPAAWPSGIGANTENPMWSEHSKNKTAFSISYIVRFLDHRRCLPNGLNGWFLNLSVLLGWSASMAYIDVRARTLHLERHLSQSLLLAWCSLVLTCDARSPNMTCAARSWSHLELSADLANVYLENVYHVTRFCKLSSEFQIAAWLRHLTSLMLELCTADFVLFSKDSLVKTLY